MNNNLLKKLKNGEEVAFKQLYDLFFHALCAFGSHYIQEDAQVADIVQEVFIKVWQRHQNFDSIYSLRSFMYLSVRNACLNYHRDNSKIIKISLSDKIPENYLKQEECFIIEEEVHRLIENEIDRLPKAVREVFNLTLLDMSVKEIAQALNLSENTVRNQRTQARKILKDKLKDKLLLCFL